MAQIVGGILRGRLNEAQRSQLLKLCRSESAPYRVVVRSWVVLLAASGKTDREISCILGVSPITVARWRTRFALFGIDGLRKEAPRTGTPPPLPSETVRQILAKTQQGRPPGRARWTTRSLAHEVGVSHTTVRRIWDRYRSRPTGPERARIAPDARFRPMKIDLEGVYVNPPRYAVAFSVGRGTFRVRQDSDVHERGESQEASRSDGIWLMDMMGALDRLDRRAASRGPGRFADQELLRFVDSLGSTGWSRRTEIVFRMERGGLPVAITRWSSRHPWISCESCVGKETWRRRLIEVVRQANPNGPIPAAPAAFPRFLGAVSTISSTGTRNARPFVWIRGR